MTIEVETFSFSQLELALSARRYDVDDDYVSGFRFDGLSVPDNFWEGGVKRRCEFVAGRMAALDCLIMIEPKREPVIDIGSGGEPLISLGHISISHTEDLAVAVVSRGRHRILGVDVEVVSPGADNEYLLSRICAKSELAVIKCFGDVDLAATIIFSAKESIFKALFSAFNVRVRWSCVKLIRCDVFASKLLFFIDDEKCLFFRGIITVMYDACGEFVCTIVDQCMEEVFLDGGYRLTALIKQSCDPLFRAIDKSILCGRAIFMER
ncbi:4'-phosphopantetheinyl transferase superfamily protein [Marinobacter sp. LN3S78]|uniref:4'-phosphopantetheinyl transferase superfamily protein n=1 Tax=Marinobacter sp. LN3S78 TaxID=3382300 RepID=UPI00387AD47E